MADPNIFTPYLPKEEYLWPAWFGCLSWAIGDAEVLAAFRAATGNQWEPGRTPLAQMIDTATGADRVFLEQFAQWMNANVWGEE